MTRNDTVKVRYAKPASETLREVAGNVVANLGDQVVANATGILAMVSNTGQTPGDFGNANPDQAQAFTMGSHDEVTG